MAASAFNQIFVHPPRETSNPATAPNLSFVRLLQRSVDPDPKSAARTSKVSCQTLAHPKLGSDLRRDSLSPDSTTSTSATSRTNSRTPRLKYSSSPRLETKRFDPREICPKDPWRSTNTTTTPDSAEEIQIVIFGKVFQGKRMVDPVWGRFPIHPIEQQPTLVNLQVPADPRKVDESFVSPARARKTRSARVSEPSFRSILNSFQLPVDPERLDRSPRIGTESHLDVQTTKMLGPDSLESTRSPDKSRIFIPVPPGPVLPEATKSDFQSQNADAMPIMAAHFYSTGSLGHPFSCAEACRYVKRRGGCRNGSNCYSCHMCFWRRPENQEQTSASGFK